MFYFRWVHDLSRAISGQ